MSTKNPKFIYGRENPDYTGPERAGAGQAANGSKESASGDFHVGDDQALNEKYEETWDKVSDMLDEDFNGIEGYLNFTDREGVRISRDDAIDRVAIAAENDVFDDGDGNLNDALENSGVRMQVQIPGDGIIGEANVDYLSKNSENWGSSTPPGRFTISAHQYFSNQESNKVLVDGIHSHSAHGIIDQDTLDANVRREIANEVPDEDFKDAALGLYEIEHESYMETVYEHQDLGRKPPKNDIDTPDYEELRGYAEENWQDFYDEGEGWDISADVVADHYRDNHM